MEDLVPLLIFIVIAAVNFMKHLAEKGGRQAPPTAEEAPREPISGSLEDIFEEIERKFQPAPHQLPDWPEQIEQPDYVQEMKAYEAAQSAGREAHTLPQTEPEPLGTVQRRRETIQLQEIGKTVSFKIPAQGAVFSGLGHMRIAMPPLLRSAAGKTHFELKNRKQLRQALIASMVFGQPRACDRSFDTTLAK